MKNLINSFGGRKVFWGLITIILLFVAGLFMPDAAYPVFASYEFYIYAAMTLGNVATKFSPIANLSNNTNSNKNE